MEMNVLNAAERLSLVELEKKAPNHVLIPEEHLTKFYELGFADRYGGKPCLTGNGRTYLVQSRRLPNKHMTNKLQGRQLYRGDIDAVQFDISIDGKHHSCLIIRDILNDLSQSNSKGDALLTEYDSHQALIAKKAEIAIRGGLTGNPFFVIPSEMFFPKQKINGK